jgi:tRNA(Arg) A34 adenosine deaminase TadA
VFPQNQFMQHALLLAKKAYKQDEVPVGSVIVKGVEIISSQHNHVKSHIDPTAHAEILCIKEAAQKLATNHLNECDIYTTLEPCAMCAQALAWAKIKRIYFAAYDEKFGATGSRLNIFNEHSVNYKPEIYGGIMEEESAQLLQNFFRKKRRNNY